MDCMPVKISCIRMEQPELIYKAGEQVASLTTDDKGQASVNGLYLGKYYVKEITPPTGYLADTEEHDLDMQL